jgi:Zn-dependent metalloprotease
MRTRRARRLHRCRPSITRAAALASAFVLALAGDAAAYDRDLRVEALEVHRTDPATVHSQPGQWRLTRDDDRWDAFLGQRGESWRVRWNEATRTPHRAFGGTVPAAALGKPAPAGSRDKQAVLALAEAFVAAEPELLGGIRWSDLRPLFAAFRGGRWCVTLQQQAGGLDVVGGRVDLRFSPAGDLLIFGADVYPVEQRPAGARLTPLRAIESARAGLGAGASVAPRGDEAPALVLLPVVDGEPGPAGVRKTAPRAVDPASVRVREAYRMRVRTADPPGDWMTYVDATTGEVLWRYNRVRFIVTGGTVTGDVHPANGTDPLVSQPLPHVNLFGGVTTGTIATYTFETGTQGWTATAPWARSSESPHGGTWGFSDSPGMPYFDNVDISLVSPTINLSGVQDAVVDFWLRTALEDTYDYLYVEGSSDNGATWKTLRGLTGSSVFHLESVDLAAIEGSATARVRFRFFSDGGVTDDGAWIDDVTIARRGSAVADAAGTYSISTTGANNNVSTGLRGLFGDIYRVDDAEPVQTVLATGATTNIHWNAVNSIASERDMYAAIHIAYARIKQIDPGFIGLDYPLPVHVGVQNYCNAFWNGSAVVFGAGTGPTCADLGTWAGVMHHEYGHGITDHTYEAVGDPPGDMHEGLSDYYAATILNDPRVGPGLVGPGTNFRTIANRWRDPEDRAGEVHWDGTIIAAALWDMRTALLPDVDLADSLFHFARYGFPYSFEDYFLEVLSVDDNDGNLGNGTPHLQAIRSAFGYHGIGYGPEFKHVAVTVQDGASGNGDGRLDAGETANILLSLRNFGGAETGVYAKVSTSTPGATVLVDSVFVGNVGAASEITLPATFQVTIAPEVTVGTAIVFDLDLRSSVGFNGDAFMLPVGYVPILLVDDDRMRGLEPYYEASLQRLGKQWTRWDVAVLASPTAEEMAEYCAVIWFCTTDAVTTLGPGNQAEIAQYLQGGGSLFVTGTNIAEDLWSGPTASPADRTFFENFLHATVNMASEGTPPPAVNGVGGDPIGNGLTLSLTGGTGADNQTSAASLLLRPGAVSSMTYANGRIAALRFATGHKVFHCGFGFEGISADADRDSVMARTLRWLCPAEAVAPTVVVGQPNGGEMLVGLAAYTIEWTATDATAVLAVDIDLSTDGGANWTPIATGAPNDFAHAWTVNNVSSTQCRIRVRAHDPWGNIGSDLSNADFTIDASTDAEPPAVPRAFALHPAVPNPFNPTTRLQFDLVSPAAVQLEVVGVDGRLVRSLVDGRHYPAGRHEAVWNGRDDRGHPVAGGVYVVRLRAGDRTATRKVQLVK